MSGNGDGQDIGELFTKLEVPTLVAEADPLSSYDVTVYGDVDEAMRAAARKRWEDLTWRINPFKLARFLQKLEQGATVRESCVYAELSVGAVRERRKLDAEFARFYQQAMDMGADRLEEEAIRRAVKGVEDPVFYQGEVCGFKRVYSDGLLIKLLQAKRPEEYRERVAHEHSVAPTPIELPATEDHRSAVLQILRDVTEQGTDKKIASGE